MFRFLPFVHEKVFDPIPCEPGTFNFMIGQVKCSECPIGYYCPINGLLDPVICSPGKILFLRLVDPYYLTGLLSSQAMFAPRKVWPVQTFGARQDCKL